MTLHVSAVCGSPYFTGPLRFVRRERARRARARVNERERARLFDSVLTQTLEALSDAVSNYRPPPASRAHTNSHSLIRATTKQTRFLCRWFFCVCCVCTMSQPRRRRRQPSRATAAAAADEHHRTPHTQARVTL